MKNYVETHTMMRRGVIMGLRADWNYILQSRYRNPKELDLFRTLMEVLQMRNRQYVFIEETHSIVRVGYLSPKLGYKQVNKEIADLLIIYNDTKNKEIRISFLQAKRSSSGCLFRCRLPYKFDGDFFQWELLVTRPKIIVANHKLFLCPDILSFTDYKTISSFGVFYEYVNGGWDMFFTIPEFLFPLNFYKIIPKRNTKLQLNYCLSYHMCNYNCSWQYGKHKEVNFVCNIDTFEHVLLKGQIGAPIRRHLNIVSIIKKHISELNAHVNNDNTIGQDIKNRRLTALNLAWNTLLGYDSDTRYGIGEVNGVHFGGRIGINTLIITGGIDELSSYDVVK